MVQLLSVCNCEYKHHRLTYVHAHTSTPHKPLLKPLLPKSQALTRSCCMYHIPVVCHDICINVSRVHDFYIQMCNYVCVRAVHDCVSACRILYLHALHSCTSVYTQVVVCQAGLGVHFYYIEMTTSMNK